MAASSFTNPDISQRADKSVSIIFVRGLSFEEDPKGPWKDSGGAFWPERRLRADFPRARILMVHQACSTNESPWKYLDRRAAHLVEQLNDATHNACAPLVFFCHGLGGYIALKALRLSQHEGRSSKRRIYDETVSIVFFGTPLNHTKQTPFKTAIRDCATIELSCSKRALDPTEEDIEYYAQLVQGVLNKRIHVVAVSESRKCQSSGTKSSWIPGRKKIIVDKDLIQLDGITCLVSEESHHSITSCSMPIYGRIVKIIRANLTNFHQSSQLSGGAAFRAGTSLDNVKVREPTTSSVALLRNTNPGEPGVTTGSAARDAGQKWPASLHYVDFPENPNFVGRRDILKTIHQRLVRDDVNAPETSPASRAFALWAPKGFGKTQTARRFAVETAENFPYILWVNAGDEAGIMETYATFATRLGLVDEAAGFLRAAKVLLDWFRSLEKHFLVIFDNAEDANLVNRWWPHGKMGSVLVTTLDPSFGTSNVAGSGAPLETFDEDSAIEMMLSQVSDHAKNDADQGRNEAREIVRRVAHLPMAIQHCLGMINESGRTLSQFNKKYRNPTSVLLRTSDNKVNRPYAPYHQGLTDTLQDRLEALDGDSRALMDAFSLLYNVRIPESMFDIDPPEDLHDVDFLQDFERCIVKVSKGLVLRAGDDLSTFYLHSLLRDFLRDNMTKQSRQVAFDTVTRLISIALDQKNYPPNMARRMADRKYFLEYFKHTESIRLFCEEALDAKGQHELEIPVFFIAMLEASSWLCYATGFFMDGLAHVKTAERVLDMLQRHSAALTKTPTPDYAADVTIRIYHNHACIATEIGDFKLSLTMFEKEMIFYNEAVRAGIKDPGGRSRLGIIHGGIANSLQGLGDHLAAEAEYRRCLECAQQKDDIHSSYEVNICRSQWARGANDEASKRLEELIRLREAEYGPDDVKDFVIGHQKYVLGNVRIDQGRLPEAFDLHQSALACWRNTLGEEHHKTGDAWHKMGWHFARLCRWKDAKNALESALNVYRSGKDEEFRHGEIARSSYKLAQVLQALNEPADKCRELMHSAEAIRTTMSPDEQTQQRALREGETEEQNREAVYDQLVSLWAR